MDMSHFMRRGIILFLLALFVCALVPAVSADKTYDSPVYDDLLVSNETIVINDIVYGDVVAMGSSVTINGDVLGDVIVLSGELDVNGKVAGKVYAVSGDVTIRGDVRKLYIVSGMLEIEASANVATDVYVISGTVKNHGVIIGKLSVIAGTLENNGRAGSVEEEEFQWPDTGVPGVIKNVARLFHLLFAIGLFIVGLLLFSTFKDKFIAIEREIHASPVINTIVGFVLIIATAIISTLLMVTVIGIPLGLLIGLMTFVALLLSTLFVSLALGRTIASAFKLEARDIVLFIVGFIILNVLFFVPYLGIIVRIVAVSLGFGAIFMAAKTHWNDIKRCAS
jgi:cytoskeletal protein CcmA (bactofilin family)